MQTSLFASLVVCNHLLIIIYCFLSFYGISASDEVSFRVSKHFGEPNECEKACSRWGPHVWTRNSVVL